MGTNQQVSQKVTQRLLHEIQAGCFKGMNSLPPEVEIAESFGVSRNMIREALTVLEREGWVTRKHGVGTLINKHVVDLETRLDLNFELAHTLEMTGSEVETVISRVEIMEAGEHYGEKLAVDPDDKVLCVARLIKADGKPAVYCIDYLPMKLMEDREYSREDMEGNVFEFMRDNCGTEVETSLAELRAMPVTQEVAQAMELPMTTALLYLDEVSYDFRSNPVLYSEEYFIDRAIRQTIVRKKI